MPDPTNGYTEETPEDQRKALAVFPKIAQSLPTVEELDLFSNVAERLYGSAFIPQSLIPKRGAPGEPYTPEVVKRITIANAIGAMLKGREMGFGQMESLTSVWASPDGSLRMWSQTMLALMLKRGFKLEWKHIGPDYAELYGKRPGSNGIEVTRKWSIDDTKTFFGVIKSDSNWQKDPEDMNVARAIGRVFRTIASDIVGAPVYDPSEVIEADYEVGEKVETSSSASADYTVRLKTDGAIPPQTMTIPEDPKTAQKPESEPARRGRKPKGSPQDDSPEPGHASAPPGSSEPATGTAAPPEATAGDAHKVEYQVFTEPHPNGALIAVMSDPSYQRPDVSELRCQALANSTGLTHVVMRVEAGKMKEHFRATGKAAPAEPASTAAAPKAAEPAAATESNKQNPATKRLGALAEFMKTPGPTALARFNNFFCGYLGIPDMKEMRKASASIPQASKDEAMDALELTVWRDAQLFNSSPLAVGETAAATVAAIRKYGEKNWKGEPTEYAWRVALLWGISAENFEKWCDTLQLDFYGPADASAFFRLCLHTPISRPGHKLAKLANEQKLLLSDLVKFVEDAIKSRIEDAKESDIEKAVDQVVSSIKAGPKEKPVAKPADTPPPPAASPATEKPAKEDEWNLFS